MLLWTVTSTRGNFFAHDRKPQRRVGGVAVGNIVAMNGVGQRAVLFKSREREQNLFHFLHHARRQKSARANQRVAAPIQKPRITGDDGLAVVAADDKRARRLQQLRLKIFVPRAALSSFQCDSRVSSISAVTVSVTLAPFGSGNSNQPGL